MPQIATIAEQNRLLAEKINAEARREAESGYAGRFVGIANARVICVDADPRVVIERLAQVEPDVELRLCFEAGLDYESAEEIWNIR